MAPHAILTLCLSCAARVRDSCAGSAHKARGRGPQGRQPLKFSGSSATASHTHVATLHATWFPCCSFIPNPYEGERTTKPGGLVPYRRCICLDGGGSRRRRLQVFAGDK